MPTTAKIRLSNFRGDATAQRNLAKLLYARNLGGDREVQQLVGGEALTLEIPWADLDVFQKAIGNYAVEVEELRGAVE